MASWPWISMDYVKKSDSNSRTWNNNSCDLQLLTIIPEVTTSQSDSTAKMQCGVGSAGHKHIELHDNNTSTVPLTPLNLHVKLAS